MDLVPDDLTEPQVSEGLRGGAAEGSGAGVREEEEEARVE